MAVAQRSHVKGRKALDPSVTICAFARFGKGHPDGPFDKGLWMLADSQ